MDNKITIIILIKNTMSSVFVNLIRWHLIVENLWMYCLLAKIQIKYLDWFSNFKLFIHSIQFFILIRLILLFIQTHQIIFFIKNFLYFFVVFNSLHYLQYLKINLLLLLISIFLVHSSYFFMFQSLLFSLLFLLFCFLDQIQHLHF